MRAMFAQYVVDIEKTVFIHIYNYQLLLYDKFKIDPISVKLNSFGLGANFHPQTHQLDKLQSRK